MAKLLDYAVDEDWPEQPTRFWMDHTMPDFWPPQPSWFWGGMIRLLQGWYARNKWMVSQLCFTGLEPAFRSIHPQDGVILAPNHSHEADAHVMLEMARRLGREVYFMVAWRTFRRHKGIDERVDEEICRKALDGLADVQLALQLFSYPGDYVTEAPTAHRMAETIEKFEEDVFGMSRSIGPRSATVRCGEPLDLKAEMHSGRSREQVPKLTGRLEDALQRLLLNEPEIDRARNRDAR